MHWTNTLNYLQPKNEVGVTFWQGIEPEAMSWRIGANPSRDVAPP